MLVDIATLRDFQFNIPTDNIENTTYYEGLIKSATSIIESYIGYSFVPSSYVEYYDDMKNSRYLVVKNLPLIRVDDIFINGSSYTGDYTFNKDTGIIRFENGFPNGTNIMLEYTAGYEVLPDDIKYAAMELVQYLRKRMSNSLVGETSKTIDGGSMALEVSIPLNVLHILNRYKNRSICVS